MIRKLVRNLIAPLVRWAWIGQTVVFAIGRGGDGGVCLRFGMAGAVCYHHMTPDQARSWGAAFYRAAHDAQDGVPLPADDEPEDDDASDLRW